MQPLRTLFLIAGILATAHMILSALVLAAHFVGYPLDRPGDMFATMFFSFAAAFCFFIIYESAPK